MLNELAVSLRPAVLWMLVTRVSPTSHVWNMFVTVSLKSTMYWINL